MKKSILYKKENNLYQSKDWLNFQKDYGRKVFFNKAFSGIFLDLPFGKTAVWAQKGPINLLKLSGLIGLNPKKVKKELGLPKKTIFIRVEPLKVQTKEKKALSLIKVGSGSIFLNQKSPKATQIIDISFSEDKILAQMKPKTRYNIRLAQKKGVNIKRSCDVDILFELLGKTSLRQKNYFTHPKIYYKKLVKNLKKKEIVQVFVAYDNEDTPIAAILVSFFGEVATYLHGGFSDKSRNLMAPYLCHMEAIRYAKSCGCNYYDMWGVAESDNVDDPWAGITRFKEGFGGEKIIFSGSFDYVLDKRWYYLLTSIARMRRLFKR